MSKKQKRKTASKRIPSTVDQPVARVAATSTSSAPRSVIANTQATKISQTARSQRQGIMTDYRYVTSDLKRIAVVAFAMFAIIVLLSFVIR